MTFKKIIFVLSFLLLLTSCWKKSSKIKVAIEGAYPPFSKTEPDGSVTGFDIDISEALCDKLEAECELVPQEWDGMIPGLIAKKYDVIIASMSITEERKKKVNFTQKYYATTASFVGPKDSDLKIVKDDLAANRAGLKGKIIGVQQATVSDRFVSDNYGDVVKEIKRYAKQDEVNLDLISGRVDFIFVDTLAILSFLNPAEGVDDSFSEKGKNFKLIGDSFAHEKWFGEGIGIAIRKEDDDLLEKFNQAIAAIRLDGTYDTIQANYFDFDIYGD